MGNLSEPVPRANIQAIIAAETAKEIVELLQLRLDHIVVVISPRVSRDPSCSSGFWPASCLFTLEIIQRQDNNRARTRQNFPRIATLLFAALHVMHFAVRAFAQPCAKFT